MDDENGDEINGAYLSQPVTRLELWRALSKVRRMTLALQLQTLSLTAQDYRKAREVAADLEEIGKEIDQTLESLLHAPKG